MKGHTHGEIYTGWDIHIRRGHTHGEAYVASDSRMIPILVNPVSHGCGEIFTNRVKKPLVVGNISRDLEPILVGHAMRLIAKFIVSSVVPRVSLLPLDL